MKLIQRFDWVMVDGCSFVGCVRRVACDGSWVDVDWGTHVKRMQVQVLRIQTTIQVGDWEVTDWTRKWDLEGGV